jgi:hypothetical protein
LSKLSLRTIAPIIVVFLFSGVVVSAGNKNFETLFKGNGDIASCIYFTQNSSYFIDNDLKASLETFRYKRFYFLLDLHQETYMGRKYHSNMVFDPNRGSWSFGFAGRLEFSKYFIETQLHHDCFHDIGRWMAIDYSIYWNSPRIGFGSIGYLQKYKYSQPNAGGEGLVWKNKIDYEVMASFFAPKGGSWQKNHDYAFSLSTDFIYQMVRYHRLGFNIESTNLWVINSNHNLKRRHELTFDFTIYGNHGALVTYIGWWPYDNQTIRNHDGKTVFGLHFAF